MPFRAPDRELNKLGKKTTKGLVKRIAEKHESSFISSKEAGKIRIASWNIHGQFGTQKGRLVDDMQKKKIDIACLQETMYKNQTDYYEEHDIKGGCLITIEPEDMFNKRQGTTEARTAHEDSEIHYGMGFYISPRLESRHIGC